MARQNTLTKSKVSIETDSQHIGKATIKANNSSHIVQVLVNNIYSNKEASAVREILSNAIDAHNMSNSNKKVDIQLPTKAFPMLKIRDYGPGLSPEYMNNEYLSLGHSEKRDRNDAVGFMGLGRFAFFSLFKNYFVTSYYKGKKYSYTIHLDEMGDIALSVLHDEVEDTDEPNGLEVFVFVEQEDRMQRFQKEIFKLTFFCKDKVNIQNLDEDEFPSWYNLKPVMEIGNIKIFNKENDKVFSKIFKTSTYESALYGIFDNIPYRLSHDFETEHIKKLMEQFQNKCLVTLNLPIGSVERNASREGLELDKENKTIKALDKIAIKALMNIAKYKVKLVENVKNFSDLADKTVEFFKYFDGNEILTWTSPKGIEHTINQYGFTSEIFKNNLYSYTIDRNGRLMSDEVSINRYRSVKYESNKSSFLVLDTTESEAQWRKRVKNYMQTSNIEKVFIYGKEVENELVETFLKEIEATKISSLAKPVKVVSEKEKEIICFHAVSENYGGYTSYALDSINLTPADLKEAIVVYFCAKKRKLEDWPSELDRRQQFREVHRFFKQVGGTISVNGKTIPKIFLCGVSERNISKIKKLKNFYSWDSFIEKLPTLYPLTDAHFANGKKEFFRDYNKRCVLDIAALVSRSRKIKDKNFVKNCKKLIKYQTESENIESENVAESILKLYNSSYTDAISEIEDSFNSTTEMIKSYPLLERLSNSGYLAEEFNDVIIYMNAKFESK